MTLLPRRLSLAVLGSLAVIAAAQTLAAGDWPQWRGPRGDSVSTEKGLAVEWSETKSIVWKTKLPEWGTSTPAIWGKSIFLTSNENEKLLLLKLDKTTGKIEWTREVGTGAANDSVPQKLAGGGSRGGQKFHKLHNLASPSPVTDGNEVIVHFGNGDLAAYDFAGKRLWKRNLQDEHGKYTIWWGHANSPVLDGNLVISVCMQDSLIDLGEPPSPSYLVAHDRRTGVEKWKTMRMTNAVREECDSYITPLLTETNGRRELIVIGGDELTAYEPSSGKPIWTLPGLAKSRIITGPTIGQGKIFATMGMRGPLLAVPLGGSGQRLADDISWKYDKGTPDSCSPVLWNDLIFIVSDNGIAQCLDSKTGAQHWQERLTGDYKASPLAADGRIYFLNTSGLCTVLAASAKFEKLAENKLDDDTIASPAVSGGHIFIRSRRSLYCISRVSD